MPPHHLEYPHRRSATFVAMNNVALTLHSLGLCDPKRSHITLNPKTTLEICNPKIKLRYIKPFTYPRTLKPYLLYSDTHLYSALNHICVTAISLYVPCTPNSKTLLLPNTSQAPTPYPFPPPQKNPQKPSSPSKTLKILFPPPPATYEYPLSGSGGAHCPHPHGNQNL